MCSNTKHSHTHYKDQITAVVSFGPAEKYGLMSQFNWPLSYTVSKLTNAAVKTVRHGHRVCDDARDVLRELDCWSRLAVDNRACFDEYAALLSS